MAQRRGRRDHGVREAPTRKLEQAEEKSEGERETERSLVRQSP